MIRAELRGMLNEAIRIKDGASKRLGVRVSYPPG